MKYIFENDTLFPQKIRYLIENRFVCHYSTFVTIALGMKNRKKCKLFYTEQKCSNGNSNDQYDRGLFFYLQTEYH